MYPVHRMRRLRATGRLRDMVRESSLSRNDLILPLFVREGKGAAKPIASMPGCAQESIDVLCETCRAAAGEGVPAIILFGIPDKKDAAGTGGYAENNLVARAIAAVKKAAPELCVVADVCLCEYTDHGHCGIVEISGEGHGDRARVVNDQTVDLLARAAVSYAQAGADIVAPSDMMDGRVRVLRQQLDGAGLLDTPIMSYAAKYASAYYGPFRDAAESAPKFGDRKTYQMDPGNGREALREVALDIEEGADIVIVKPALAYMDIIRRVRERFDVPVAAYNVSGEYAMICAAAERGWVDRERMMLETLLGFKRAGADLILTYFARDAAKLLG